MLRPILIAIARRQYVAAATAFRAYMEQPATGEWHINIAMALEYRKDAAALRLGQLIAR